MAACGMVQQEFGAVKTI